MKIFTDTKRFEVKYFIPNELIPKVREYIQPFAEVDPYTLKSKNKRYKVRSIYYDTPDLDFYYAKIEGLKIRKKLRIRGYNLQKSFAFLEIKRKYVNNVVKERCRLPFSFIGKIVTDQDTTSIEPYKKDYNTRLVSGKFLNILANSGLEPTVMVVYEREAYVGTEDNRLRVTIDSNVRIRSKPELDDLFDGAPSKVFPGDISIFELKFDNFMPDWMRRLPLKLGIRKEPISKYCLGIDVSQLRYVEED
jgi:SPX domain protein involved in polyphosphate accumulation